MPVLMCRFKATETNSSSAHAWVYSSLEQSWVRESSGNPQDLSEFKPENGELYLDYSNLSNWSAWDSQPLRKLGYFHNALKNAGWEDELRDMYHQLCLKTGATSLYITHSHDNDNWENPDPETDSEQTMEGMVCANGSFALMGNVDVDMGASMDVLLDHLGKYSLRSNENVGETLIDAVFADDLVFHIYHDGNVSFSDVAIENHQIEALGKLLANHFGMSYKGFLEQLSLIREGTPPKTIITNFALNLRMSYMEEDFKQRRHSFKGSFEDFCQEAKKVVQKHFTAYDYGVGNNA